MATEPAPETQSATETATKPKLNLSPPEALQPVAPAEAAGLVPLKEEETSELDRRVGQFVDELAKPRFEQPRLRQEGRPADRDGPQGDRGGRRRVEPIPRSAGQGDRQGHRHRRRPHRAAPNRRGARPQGSDQDAQAARDHSLRQPGRPLLRQVPQLADPHSEDPRQPRQRQGRAADGQCRDRHRARQSVEDDAQARADGAHLQDAGPAPRGQGQRARRDRSRQGQGDPRDRALLHPPAHHRPADPDGGDGAGLSRARPRQEEQCRAGERRRPRFDHDRRRRFAPR